MFGSWYMNFIFCHQSVDKKREMDWTFKRSNNMMMMTWKNNFTYSWGLEFFFFSNRMSEKFHSVPHLPFFYYQSLLSLSLSIPWPYMSIWTDWTWFHSQKILSVFNFFFFRKDTTFISKCKFNHVSTEKWSIQPLFLSFPTCDDLISANRSNFRFFISRKLKK